MGIFFPSKRLVGIILWLGLTHGILAWKNPAPIPQNSRCRGDLLLCKANPGVLGQGREPDMQNPSVSAPLSPRGWHPGHLRVGTGIRAPPGMGRPRIPWEFPERWDRTLGEVELNTGLSGIKH